ncbi:MAG: MFS transporter [Armatimonadota bacterium]|nr:MFS transporter [Armatimonadota bacterium]
MRSGFPLGRLADWLGHRAMMAAGTVACAAGAAGAMAVTDYWAATACLFVVGVGWSAGLVAATALLANATSARLRGRTFGMTEFAARLANLLFPVAGAGAASLWGFAGTAGIAATVTLLPMLLIWRMPSPSASG